MVSFDASVSFVLRVGAGPELDFVSCQVVAGVEQAGGIKKFLFNLAFQSKKAELERLVTVLGC